MPPSTVKPQLQKLQEQITGVVFAYADAPNTINAADAPCFVNLEGAAEFDYQIYGPGTYQEAREYKMVLFVAPRGSGVPGEAVNRCTPFFDAVNTFFAARPQLGALAGVQQATLLGDGGVVALKFGDDDWVGVEFRLKVVEAVPYSFAALE